MNTQDLINRLIDKGSFDLNSDAEFMQLSRAEQIRVRMIVRSNLLMEA